MTQIIQILDYQYPIGWEWLHNVPLEDWQWLLDIFATTTDNTETYDYAEYLDCQNKPIKDRVTRIGGEVKDNYINRVDTQSLAKFMDDDQGYSGGIQIYGYYIAAKTLGIKSEEEFLDNMDRIEQICNR